MQYYLLRKDKEEELRLLMFLNDVLASSPSDSS